MYYYQHHIGDYRRDTGHLTLLEHGIYRQLLDLYYLSENPVDTNAIRLLSIRSTDDCEAYKRVLSDFFIERDGLYFHKRCDFEIQRFKDKSNKATQNIKTRWNKNKGLASDTPVLPTNNDGTTNLITNKPINLITKVKTKRVSVSMPLGINETLWKDFLATRKAPITQTAINGIAKQATLAGMSFEAALEMACERGWQSFKADWIKPQQGAKNGKFNVHAYTSEKLARELAAEAVGHCPAQKVLDALPSEIYKLFPESGNGG